MKAAYHASLNIMVKILIIETVVLSLPLLPGCWPMHLEAETPSEYIKQKNALGSLYGATSEDIIGYLGEPKSVEHRRSSRYFIYEWRRTDKDIVFLVVVPVAGGRAKIKWHCLFLEFDEDNRLVNHESATLQYDDPAPWGALGDTPEKRINCLRKFKENMAQVSRVQKIKKSATQGDPVSQFRFYEFDEHDVKRLAFLCRAADQQYTPAMRKLATGYWRGHTPGIKKDLRYAYVWFKLTANLISEETIAWETQQVTKSMTPSELVEAEQMLADWKPWQCERDLGLTDAEK